jgi:hypothetical protein
MMPVVRVADGTFTDLKSIATWFGTKTPSETIDRIVREAMEQLGLERDVEPTATSLPEPNADTTTSIAMKFDKAPGLTFTKPLSAKVNGKALRSPRWSSILLTMIDHLKASGLEGEQLVRELGIPAKSGRYEDEGFKFHPDLGISVQGQSASDAWKEIDRIAKKLRIPVTVEFWWRHNQKAQYPGRVGLLSSGS